MKYLLAYSALFAAVLARPTGDGDMDDLDYMGGKEDSGEKACSSGQSVVCQGNGNGGLLSLGNLLTGLLGESCSGGDVYCCETEKVDQVSCSSSPQDARANLENFSDWLDQPGPQPPVLPQPPSLNCYRSFYLTLERWK